ncbi:methylthioadenosine nucleosidase [Thermoplasmatales archaeon BRNA1]|nr:methylthioadenosine nucleosidase [Thermoplasmatales archaeon BRNA1]
MKSSLVLAAVVIAVIASSVCTYAAVGYDPSDETHRLGIIGAMDDEVDSLKASMHIDRKETVAGMEFCIGTLEGKDVVVVRCGMGKVNAGICANTLINQFGVDRIINTGVAGSLDNGLDIGDLVISSEAVQHDFDVSPIGFAKGEIPYTGLVAFPADASLIDSALRAASECAPEIKAVKGRVCSGDQFINTNEQKDRITADFGGLCCEMEGGAIAHACCLNEIPYVIIRAISDKPDGSSSMDYSEFEKEAAQRCASIVHYMVKNLA